MRLATQDDHTWLYTDDGQVRVRAWKLARRLGATGVRFVVYESYVARLGWGFVQRAVFEATAHGLAPQIVLTGPPRWDPVGGLLTYDKPSPTRFAEWVRQAAFALPTVETWSLWNEPNLPQFLPGGAVTHVAAVYSHLWEHGSEALRAESPHARILFGELSGGAHAAAFLRSAAHGFHADGMAIHSYQFGSSPSHAGPRGTYGFGNLGALSADLHTLAHERKLSNHRGHSLPIYVTEFGYPAHGWPHARPERERASWMARAMQLGRHRGLAQLLYYHLIEAPPGTAWNTGIAKIDGHATSLSPTFSAIAKEARR